MSRKTFDRAITEELTLILKEEFEEGYKLRGHKDAIEDFVMQNIWEYIHDDLREIIQDYISQEDVEEKD